MVKAELTQIEKEDIVDSEMREKGYLYKIIPVGDHDGLDPLYAKTPEEAKCYREGKDPMFMGWKFRVEFT